MIKLKVRVVDKKTMKPIKNARVAIWEDTGDKPNRNDDRLFMNTLTNDDGIAETRAYLLNDIYIFIRIRCASNNYYMEPMEFRNIIGPNKELDIEVLAKEDWEEPDKSIFKIIKNMFQGV